MVCGVANEHDELWLGLSEGGETLTQGRGLDEGESDPDLDGSELS